MQFYMPPIKPSAIRPPACKLLGFPALSNGNSPPQLIALSTIYPWYSLNTVLQSAIPYKITKRAHNFTYILRMGTQILLPVCCAMFSHVRISNSDSYSEHTSTCSQWLDLGNLFAIWTLRQNCLHILEHEHNASCQLSAGTNYWLHIYIWCLF